MAPRSRRLRRRYRVSPPPPPARTDAAISSVVAAVHRAVSWAGCPRASLTREPLALTISDALNRALKNNLGVLLAEEGIDQAQGARWRALSGLLPDVNGHITEARQVVNLAAFGFPLPAGIPAIVGPFNTFDARVSLSQAVVDFKALNDSRAETHNLAAARHDYKSARDLVVLVATVSYAQALASSARVDAAQAQVDTARALFDQATDLKQSGIVPGIDVLRAEVQLGTERQRATAARNELEKAKLQLARLIGLPLGQSFTLATELAPVNIPEMTLDQALERAYRTRPDYLAALERVKAAEAARQAAIGETLPSVRINANYGDLGLSVSDSHYTYTVAGTARHPDFPGRTGARPQARSGDGSAAAAHRCRRFEGSDLLRGPDRDAGPADRQRAARSRDPGADAGGQRAAQARDRFAAGVAGNIEVVQAQSAVTLADDQYISALFTTSLAKGSLVRAVGIAEETAREIFGGLR